MDIPGHEVTLRQVHNLGEPRWYFFICECGTFEIRGQSLQKCMQETLHHLVSAAGMTPLA